MESQKDTENQKLLEDNQQKDNQENNENQQVSITNLQFQNKCFPNQFASRIILIFCIIYIIQDIFTHQAFYKASAEFTVSIQKYDAQSWINFNIFVSNGCIVLMGIIIIAFIALLKNRLSLFSLVTYFLFCIYLMSILKLIYNNPRPYMSSPDIMALECATEYGNPSGHSMLNMLAYLLFPYLYDKNFYQFKKNDNENKFCVKKIIFCILNITWIVMIGFSRVYVGVHSLNQIFLGFIYGIFCAVFYIEYFNEYVDQKLIYFINCNPQQKFNYLKKTIFLFIALTAVNISLYELVKNLESEIIIQDALKAILIQCEDAMTIRDVKFLFNKCFVDAGVFSGSFAVLFAIFSSKGVYKQGDVYANSVQQLQRRQIFYRTCIQLTPAILIFVPCFILGHFVFQNEVYLKYFITMNLGIFSAIFCIAYVSPLLLHHFKLDINGDFLQKQSLIDSLSQITKQNYNNTNSKNNSFQDNNTVVYSNSIRKTLQESIDKQNQISNKNNSGTQNDLSEIKDQQTSDDEEN